MHLESLWLHSGLEFSFQLDSDAVALGIPKPRGRDRRLAQSCCGTESATLCLLTVVLAEVNGNELILPLEAT